MRNPFKKQEEKIKFPVKILTEDGYIIIEPRYCCADVEIKRVHEKGKSWYPKVKFRMGFSDVHFIHDGSDLNKKTWTEVFHIPTGIYREEFGKIVDVLQSLREDEK